jgi:hypothetical protein
MSEPHAGEDPVAAQDCAVRHARRKPINIAPQIDCDGEMEREADCEFASFRNRGLANRAPRASRP